VEGSSREPDVSEKMADEIRVEDIKSIDHCMELMKKEDPRRLVCSKDGKFTLVVFLALGAGSFGTVSSAWCEELHRFIALKVLSLPMHGMMPRGMEMLKTELDVLKMMSSSFARNPNGGSAFATRVLKSWSDDRYAYFVSVSCLSYLRPWLCELTHCS
jgi:hypothetical protein